MAAEITLSDYLATRTVAFEWADSYDTKDWERLRKILAPAVTLDFRPLRGAMHENLTPDAFVSIISDPNVVGDARIRTQHLLGGSSLKQLDDATIEVWYQIRVAHQRYATGDSDEVVNKGHAHGAAQHVYKKVDGAWKLAAVKPRLGWSEYDLFGTLNPEGGEAKFAES